MAENTKKPELLPCPFCGYKGLFEEVSVFLDGYETWFRAGCNSCSIYTDAVFSEDIAANKWNARISGGS